MEGESTELTKITCLEATKNKWKEEDDLGQREKQQNWQKVQNLRFHAQDGGKRAEQDCKNSASWSADKGVSELTSHGKLTEEE